MDKTEATHLLDVVTPTYWELSNLQERALETDADGKFAEKDPYKRLVINQAVDCLGRLRHMLLAEKAK